MLVAPDPACVLLLTRASETLVKSWTRCTGSSPCTGVLGLDLLAAVLFVSARAHCSQVFEMAAGLNLFTIIWALPAEIRTLWVSGFGSGLFCCARHWFYCLVFHTGYPFAFYQFSLHVEFCSSI